MKGLPGQTGLPGEQVSHVETSMILMQCICLCVYGNNDAFRLPREWCGAWYIISLYI